MTPYMKEVYDLHQKGMSQRAIAKKLGRAKSTIQETIKRAEKHLNADPGVREAVEATGLSLNTARHGWRRVQSEDGNWNSVFWKMEDDEVEALTERLTDAFNNVQPAKAVKAPKHTMSEFMTVYPLYDLHFGMYAFGPETGAQDYDTEIACNNLRHAFSKLDVMTPASDTAVLILGGDTFHSDDGYETPQNKHKLDHDGRIFKVLDEGVQIFSEITDRLLHKHKTLVIRVLRGNHDIHSHMVLTFALEQRFRNESRVTVEKSSMDLFMIRHGKCMISAHHGDKAPPQRLTLYLSDVCPYWSETRHRYCFTGHVHHDQAKDIGPLRWESLRAFCPPDAYAAGLGYSQRRALQALTFHERDGLVLRAIDPVES